jgi:hypothetical protein
MSARLTEIQRQLADSRRRLEEWARRLAALRERVAGSGEARPGEGAPVPPGRDAAVPLFQSLKLGDGALDDVELTFEVLDTEDPGRDGR